MSLEIHVLLFDADLPSHRQWQEAIDALGFPVVLDTELELPVTTGFRPCTISGQRSGFEIWVDAVPELLAQYPRLRKNAGQATAALTFRWGGDMKECACVLAAAAGLLNLSASVAYYPDDDLFYTPEALQQEFHECMSGD